MQNKKSPVAGIGQDETNPLLRGNRLCGRIWLFSRYISVLLQIILNDWRPDVKKKEELSVSTVVETLYTEQKSLNWYEMLKQGD